MTRYIPRIVLLIAAVALLLLTGSLLGNHLSSGPLHTVVHADYHSEGMVPKSYGRLVAAIADRIGTGLVFEDNDGVIRFVSITGMKEGQLARYDQAPTQGGIPRSYGRLVTAVANAKGTGLIFEDSDGVIRFVTITGVVEGELRRK